VGEYTRIDRARCGAAGYVVALHTGDAMRDNTGVGYDPDGRKALPAAWRDLAERTGRKLAELKALERRPAYLRTRR
jgi:hypothetical protein